MKKDFKRLLSSLLVSLMVFAGIPTIAYGKPGMT